MEKINKNYDRKKLFWYHDPLKIYGAPKLCIVWYAKNLTQLYSKILFYFFQYWTGRILKNFHFWENFWFFWKLPLWRLKTGHFTTYQYITLVPHKSLMDHDSQKNICYHNFYLCFPICKRKTFELCTLIFFWYFTPENTTGGLEKVLSVHNSTLLLSAGQYVYVFM